MRIATWHMYIWTYKQPQNSFIYTSCLASHASLCNFYWYTRLTIVVVMVATLKLNPTDLTVCSYLCCYLSNKQSTAWFTFLFKHPTNKTALKVNTFLKMFTAGSQTLLQNSGSKWMYNYPIQINVLVEKNMNFKWIWALVSLYLFYKIWAESSGNKISCMFQEHNERPLSFYKKCTITSQTAHLVKV